MAIALDTTLSGTQANSYCTIAFADDYWESHYSATKAAQWSALSPTTAAGTISIDIAGHVTGVGTAFTKQFNGAFLTTTDQVSYVFTYLTSTTGTVAPLPVAAITAAAYTLEGTIQKTQLLVQATRIIETARFTNFVPLSEYNLHYDRLTNSVLDITLSRDPVRYYYYQKLQFPRNLDFDPVLQTLYMPIPLMMAQCEQAVYTLNFDETAVANRLQGIVSDTLEIGKNQIHLSQEYVGEGSMFAPMALEFVRPFFVRSAKQKRA
jgi:hypothetical protein